MRGWFFRLEGLPHEIPWPTHATSGQNANTTLIFDTVQRSELLSSDAGGK